MQRRHTHDVGTKRGKRKEGPTRDNAKARDHFSVGVIATDVSQMNCAFTFASASCCAAGRHNTAHTKKQGNNNKRQGREGKRHNTNKVLFYPHLSLCAIWLPSFSFLPFSCAGYAVGRFGFARRLFLLRTQPTAALPTHTHYIAHTHKESHSLLYRHASHRLYRPAACSCGGDDADRRQSGTHGGSQTHTPTTPCQHQHPRLQ